VRGPALRTRAPGPLLIHKGLANRQTPDDKTTPLQFTNELTRLINRAVERVIPTGHLGVFDDPQAFNQPLTEFLEAQPR
jgi:hypothetical protein